MNKTTATISIIAGIALGATSGAFIGHSIGVHEANNAPVTVLPCSAYADTSNPVIPPHTFTEACRNEDGTLSLPEPASD